ncbi:MAG: hypothetical protein ACXQTG_05190 [Methanoculleaceae archaeon]
MTCPFCREEIYLEELVGGRCPLCGNELDGYDGDSENEIGPEVEVPAAAWLYCILRRYSALGASPSDLFDLAITLDEMAEDGLDTAGNGIFTINVRMTLIDRIRPKKCDRCGRIFFRGGEKWATASFQSSGITITYRCPRCCGDQ